MNPILESIKYQQKALELIRKSMENVDLEIKKDKEDRANLIDKMIEEGLAPQDERDNLMNYSIEELEIMYKQQVEDNNLGVDQ